MSFSYLITMGMYSCRLDMGHVPMLRSNVRLFPLVFIQSESSTKEDHMRRLFPQQLIEDLDIAVIHFNSIAPTNLIKSLNVIAQSEKIQLPDKQALNSLATSTNGDIRAAINAFQIGSGNFF